MQRNIPDATAPLKTLSFPQHNSTWLKGFTLTASLALVILVTQNKRQFNETEGLIALDEVMSWDMTADESVSEIDEVIELIE